jgi:DNA end-binding protein Ku
LILDLMHFASEILTPEELKNAPLSAITDKELKMAQTLIDSMSASWEPEKYRDEYRNAVMEMIEQKAKKKVVPEKPAPQPRATNVVDLVKVLQESLNRNQALKPKRSGARNGSRSTSSLVRQKRRAAA